MTSAAGRTTGASSVATVVPSPIAERAAATQNGHFGISTAKATAPTEASLPRRDTVLFRFVCMIDSYVRTRPGVE